MEKVALGLRDIEPCMYRALNCIHPNLQRHRAVSCASTAFVL